MGKQSESERMEKFYNLHPWVEDPETPQGFERYQQVLKIMEQLVSHLWIQDILKDRKVIRVIDVCSGMGLAGIAFSKVLRDRGFEVNLTLIDLRLRALEKARGFALKELGFEPKTIVLDITNPLNVFEKYDVALMWGLTTPHFNPWKWIKVLINISKMLTNDGIFAYEEADRVQNIFLVRGYKDVLPEIVEENRLVLSIHAGRDSRTGDIKRLLINLFTGDRVETNVYFWDLASSAAFTWMFFEDVDFLQIESSVKGVIIANRPRRAIKPDDLLAHIPAMISH
uniref:Class I SAM-dependent methyltransferase n=1 Tax=Ignisphaera aggregans TaxID=334771 RepID=A0A7C5YXU3_9CREN